MQECKDAEPDVLFVGDSMVQLMQQFEVRQNIHISTPGHLTAHMATVSLICITTFSHDTVVELGHKLIKSWQELLSALVI